MIKCQMPEMPSYSHYVLLTMFGSIIIIYFVIKSKLSMKLVTNINALCTTQDIHSRYKAFWQWLLVIILSNNEYHLLYLFNKIYSCDKVVKGKMYLDFSNIMYYEPWK